ncbi:NifU family protein [Faecalicatena contorta]|uniref:NifU-like domain-containing protein n=1 Tax=Faecalicatena contorta TaxID=39482 RepID=A0A316A3R4_9FIRM|nr:NifU family protein [Faecalicatena contorta]PWJ51898.1 NifU-like protein [Faecalicatena contorta]SUQ12176.1 NifU-like domain-containing protein [Faecalicatena contorta]
MLNKIEKVRPELARHHGNVKVVSYENHILRVKLLGKCSGGSLPC